MTHFDFTTLGGPGFFGMPPVWSQKRKKKRQTTTAQNSGALLRPYLTLFGLAGTRSPVLSPLDNSRAGFWAASCGGSVPVHSRPARLHLILAEQRVGTIPGLTQLLQYIHIYITNPVPGS